MIRYKANGQYVDDCKEDYTLAIFQGEQAERHALEYAAWLNSKQETA